MLARVVKPGDKMEMQAIEEMELADGTKGKRKYTTKVFDIVDDDRVEIEMPMEQSKLILLPVDAEYDVYFFTKSGMFQCYVRIIERYKNDRNFVLVAEIISNLRKFQRREYYRYSCVLEMETRVLKEAEVEAISKNLSYLVPSASLRRAIIVDISGGGLRFISKERYRIGEMIYCKYSLQIDGYIKEYRHIIKDYENTGEYFETPEYIYAVDNAIQEYSAMTGEIKINKLYLAYNDNGQYEKIGTAKRV